ncbi:Protein phosphatase 1A isoform X1 [Oopsacas minuta]|uniref:Protein phosphatase 1A isoform X1 n=1 Tax=Oopsacas minuta TaxID=111878 RepID=A0AAV7KDG7_9METZ|nr:Protein phosphatase 1A isoform X1 [Oopsacas minuta]
MLLELSLLFGLLTLIALIFVIKSGRKPRPRRLRMGVFLDKPAINKEFKSGSGPCDSAYCSVSMQGWRTEMEDSARAIPDLGALDPKLKGWSFYAVFDGHAGMRASEASCDQLIECILPRLEVFDGEYNPNYVSTSLREAFLEMDVRLRKELTSKPIHDRSGTTAVAALLSDKHVFIANCGDSRGLVARDGKVFFASSDHKPYCDIEKKRIEAAGGAVLMQRVNGSLAVSRALGDFDYKAQPKLKPICQLVSPEPDVEILERCQEDQFLLLACDGVWDVMENDEVVDLIGSRLMVSESLERTTAGLLEKSLYKNSRDNMTAILVTLPAAPKFSQDAAQKDIDLVEEAKPLMQEKISEYIRLCKANSSEPQLHVVMQELVTTLDPVYEIPLRQDYVEEKINEMMKTPPKDSNSTGSPLEKKLPVSPLAK